MTVSVAFFSRLFRLTLDRKGTADLVGKGLTRIPKLATYKSADMLENTAFLITVKIFSEEGERGSGIIVHHHNQFFTVMTNKHVLGSNVEFRVQTPDNQFHRATAPDIAGNRNLDIGFLRFSASDVYSIAEMLSDENNLTEGDYVYASGYPIEDDPSYLHEFTFLTGEVGLVAPQRIEGGYQIGFNAVLAKGMSGGPLLNNSGQVVAVNGMHPYPLWGNPYVFEDGSVPSVDLREEMRHYSWAIPAFTAMRLMPESL